MSNYCVNCGERPAEWGMGAMIYFDDGVDGDHGGTLCIEVCPECNHQQIDVSGQYGDLPTEDDDAD